MIQILPPKICPSKQEDTGPARPKSGIEALSPGAGIKDGLSLPQSPLVISTVEFIWLKVPKPGAGWTAPSSLEKELALMKYYKTYRDKLPTTLPKLDSDTSKLDLSSPSSITMSTKNLDILNDKSGIS